MSVHKPVIVIAGKVKEIKPASSQYVDPAALGSGSAITTKYLRGDSTWQTVTAAPASGTVVLIYNDDTGFSASGNNSSAIAYTLAAHSYAKIIIESEVSWTGVANTASETLFDLYIGGSIISQLVIGQGATGTGDLWKLSGTIKKVTTGSGIIKIAVTQAASTPTWYIRSLRVYGVV